MHACLVKWRLLRLSGFPCQFVCQALRAYFGRPGQTTSTWLEMLCTAWDKIQLWNITPPGTRVMSTTWNQRARRHTFGWCVPKRRTLSQLQMPQFPFHWQKRWSICFCLVARICKRPCKTDRSCRQTSSAPQIWNCSSTVIVSSFRASCQAPTSGDAMLAGRTVAERFAHARTSPKEAIVHTSGT